MTNLESQPKALQDVAAEMARVRNQEGFTAGHDLGQELELLQAGIAYSWFTHAWTLFHLPMSAREAGWPSNWKPEMFKPAGFRKNLIKAATLILFAIEAFDDKERLRKGNTNHGDYT